MAIYTQNLTCRQAPKRSVLNKRFRPLIVFPMLLMHNVVEYLEAFVMSSTVGVTTRLYLIHLNALALFGWNWKISKPRHKEREKRFGHVMKRLKLLFPFLWIYFTDKIWTCYFFCKHLGGTIVLLFEWLLTKIDEFLFLKNVVSFSIVTFFNLKVVTIRTSCKVRLYGTKFALWQEGILYSQRVWGWRGGRPKGCKICTSGIK
jgi:hypothetical protein